MSTSTSSTPLASQPASSSATEQQNAKLLSTLSVAGLIICPLIMALPPRKLDIYTISLLSATAVSGNHVAQTYTGRSIVSRLTPAEPMNDLPARAQEMQRQLMEEKRAAETAKGAALEKKDESLLKKVWMGDEGDDWKAKRDQREKEALEAGKGYGDLIVDQVWEVWNRKKKDGKDGEEK
ncbi:hypothetical protein PVAG01_10458 [Phlyctema vagabunda]|uniref:Rhomboid family membrane protein n=1 Tax=Phlyctema vagabunda TaxID=108571 RepID=A0ABR4P5Z4_9HELO